MKQAATVLGSAQSGLSSQARGHSQLKPGVEYEARVDEGSAGDDSRTCGRK